MDDNSERVRKEQATAKADTGILRFAQNDDILAESAPLPSARIGAVANE
jgi:hypothetical protein